MYTTDRPFSNPSRWSRWYSTKVTIAVLMMIGALLTLFPNPGLTSPAPLPTGTTVIVGPGNQQAVGWQTLQAIFGEPGPDLGTQTYVVGPAMPPLGPGSLEFRTGNNSNWSEAVGYTGLNGVSIGAASLTELSYSTYIQQAGNAAQDFFLILVIDTNGDQTADDFLFFFPADQSGCSNGAPLQHTIMQNLWQTPWDARNGVWVSALGLCDAQESCGTAQDPKTLAEYLTCLPTARIINDNGGTAGDPSDDTPGLIIGYGGSTVSANFIGNLDNVKVGVNAVTTTFDFDPFDTCMRDDVSGNTLRFSSATGAWAFCPAKGSTVSGTGAISTVGCKLFLNQGPIKPSTTTLSATVNTCTGVGTATLTISGVTIKITDSDMTNSVCKCL